MQKEDEGSLRSQASGEVVEARALSLLLRGMARRVGAWRRTSAEHHAEFYQAAEDWGRNDEAMLAQNQRLADELALAQERIAKARQALRLDEKWSLQHGALAVRSERDRAVAERDARRAQLDEAREALVRVGCQFDMCTGPVTPPVDMRTCYVCELLARLPVSESVPATLDYAVGDLVEWNPTEEEWVSALVTGFPWGVDSISILVKENRQRLVVHRSNLRKAAPSPEAPSEASPLIHLVTLSSDTGVMGEWQAFCHGCEERAKGDMPRVAFWRDQHEADTLVPSSGQEAEK